MHIEKAARSNSPALWQGSLTTRLVFMLLLAFGYCAGVNASSCSLNDLTFGGSTNADGCGFVNRTSQLSTHGGVENWTVNTDGWGDGGGTDYTWTEFEKYDGSSDGTVDVINTVSPNIVLNDVAYDLGWDDAAVMVVFKGGRSAQHWYLYDSLSEIAGADGVYDLSMILGPYALSSASVYLSEVPLPAAVWLFGGAILGLFGGAARKKRAA